MNDILLSVVIANYNYGRFLEAAIRSVINQSGAGRCELVIVDGGSTDDSVSIIKKYSDRIAWWCSEPDDGQSAAFNKGFSHCRGKYLTWLNADDVLVPGCLAEILCALEAHPQCEWFTGNFYRFIDATKKICEIGWGPHVYPACLQRASSPIVAFGPSTIFARAIWKKLGGVDESLHYAMDTELWTRFIVNGVKQRRINCFVWAFRMHEDSKTAEFGNHQVDVKTKELIVRERATYWEKNGYRESTFLHWCLRMWRVVDGSYLHGQMLKLKRRYHEA